MHRVISVYGRKIFSVSLIFNALLTVICILGLLRGFYVDNWKPYTPFLVNGNFLWAIVALAVINIFPAAYIGKVHTGRLWFHHYVYGFAVLFTSITWVALFTSISLTNLFLVNTANVSVNVGRFLFLSGLALVLDDLPDVHRVSMHSLRWLKSKAYEARKIIYAAQAILTALVIYVLAAVILSVSQNPNWVTPANFILIGSTLVSILASFLTLKLKTWLKLETNNNEPKH
jgi:hypothetical protein